MRASQLRRGPYGWIDQPTTRELTSGTAANTPSIQFWLPVAASSIWPTRPTCGLTALIASWASLRRSAYSRARAE
jgi:hypothetical protein